jgi:hypothetical protein
MTHLQFDVGDPIAVVNEGAYDPVLSIDAIAKVTPKQYVTARGMKINRETLETIPRNWHIKIFRTDDPRIIEMQKKKKRNSAVRFLDDVCARGKSATILAQREAARDIAEYYGFTVTE